MLWLRWTLLLASNAGLFDLVVGSEPVAPASNGPDDDLAARAVVDDEAVGETGDGHQRLGAVLDGQLLVAQKRRQRPAELQAVAIFNQQLAGVHVRMFVPASSDTNPFSRPKKYLRTL